MMTRRECARWLRERDGFVILTHGKPDGDTLGSAAALCLGLRAAGKTAAVLQNPETPEDLTFLCEAVTVPELPENGLLISVDVAAPHMLPDAHAELSGRIALRIDHHRSATSFTPLELVDPDSGACAEIIFDVLAELGVELTKQMAIPLYTGMATDTGCFRFANTTAHTFAVAAACAATGADLYPINQALFDTVSLKRLRVQSWAAEHTKFYCDGKAAVCALPLSLEQELQVSEDDIGGLSGFIRSIEGVCMAATLRESREGRVLISVRAVPGYNAAALCEEFGGGGHKGAAGAGSDLPLEEAEKDLTRVMLEQLARQ